MNKINTIDFPSRPKSDLLKSRMLDDAIDHLNRARYENAESILIELVDSDFNEAYFYLGNVYELDANINPLINYDKAYFYYEKAIDTKGLVEAYIAKARLNKCEFISNPDIMEAASIYEELIANGIHLDGFVHYALGKLKYFGCLGEVDITQAEAYFREGWRHGHIPSLNGLSSLLLKKKCYIKGVFLKIYAVTLGVTVAIFNWRSKRVRQV